MIHGRKPALDLDRGCRHSVNAQWAHPTGKSIRVDRFVVASARRNRPLLEAQLPSADEIKAWLHYRRAAAREHPAVEHEHVRSPMFEVQLCEI
jgi:hypothetical protein